MRIYVLVFLHFFCLRYRWLREFIDEPNSGHVVLLKMLKHIHERTNYINSTISNGKLRKLDAVLSKEPVWRFLNALNATLLSTFLLSFFEYGYILILNVFYQSNQSNVPYASLNIYFLQPLEQQKISQQFVRTFQSLWRKHQNNLQNLFKVNNVDTRTTSFWSLY